MTDTLSLDAFSSDAKAFLDANAEPRPEGKFAWGEGSDRVGLLEEKTPEQAAADLAAAKDWKAREFDAGFGWISGPGEYGGRALPKEYDRTYAAVRSEYKIPSQEPFIIGLGMVAPTILAHAIPEVKKRYLRDLYRGDVVGCQLFSEPVAGSDLAGIQTRGVRDVDEGWSVALTTLMNERAAIGGGGAGSGLGTSSMTRFVELARHLGLADDPLVRQRLADAFVRANVARYTNLRAMAKIRAGQLPGPEMSIAKLALTQNMQQLGRTVSEIL